MPEAKNNNTSEAARDGANVAGRLLALDLGAKRVGVAVSDELRISVRPLPPLRRTSWKELLAAVADLVRRFDAKGLVIGLPLDIGGTEGPAAQDARLRARNFGLSLKLPVYLQDERLTSLEAEETLSASGKTREMIRSLVDSHAAAIILRDYIAQHTSD